ncbi:MAG: DUF4380 domain-containing protein [Chitinispirillia bacterium]|nr:DUF4380 domain-containing protein [Chitinispirillia bacterium]MCL2268456.1 DUF4380 domain-containing protein [Chitinispirillia bacterium]
MNRLIKISDGSIEVGVVPDLGGMVALLHIIGKPNILKADKALWDEPPVIRRTFGPDPRWKAYNGHIVWVGPQSEWWAHQAKSPKKLREKSVWPPDPYINNGYFEIIERGATELVMKGPDSEFSGVRLTKSVKIKNGKVIFGVSALNIRNEPVSWDLWLNTRVDGYARCYAPVSSMSKVRIDGRETETQDMSVYSHDRGYCLIEPGAPSKNKKERWAKAFIPASKGAMAAFASSQALIIKFKRHSPKLIHPEQALVEFYNYTNHTKSDALTELEYHAPYKTLQPGESMEAYQQWELHPFKPKPSHEDCIKFLQKTL